MTISEFALLLSGAVLVWFWFDSVTARDKALQAASSACRGAGVQLLDETIALHKLRLGRNDRGDPVLRRIYRFEYTNTGNNRLRGTVILEGTYVTLVDVGVLEVS